MAARQQRPFDLARKRIRDGCLVDIQGLGTYDCKTELCTHHLVANSSVDRRAQPQIAR
jgi:hypothetical protein